MRETKVNAVAALLQLTSKQEFSGFNCFFIEIDLVRNFHGKVLYD